MSLRVAIVGGGVIGASIAWFLARRGVRAMVIERDPGYARASSALSASGIRQQFSTPACIAFSRFSFAFLKDIDRHLGTVEAPADVGLVERGYLTLAGAAGAAALDTAICVQQGFGAAVARLDRPELSRRFDWLRTDDLALAALGVAGEGWFDGYSLLQAFRRRSSAEGARWIATEATGLIRREGHVCGVETRQGPLEADVVVDAAGWQAGQVAAWAGIDLPVGPERHCIYAFQCRHAPTDMPLIVDPAGIYVRPEGDLFIAGGPAVPTGDPPRFDADPEQFETVIWPALAHRVPAFERLRLVRGWAGQYDMNRFDQNAVIGWAPGAPGLLLATGFSGHGLQHAPAVGLSVAEMILDGGATSLDASAFDPRRIGENRPIRELAII